MDPEVPTAVAAAQEAVGRRRQEPVGVPPRSAAPEKVRPYTRKFEDSIMSTIDEVTIVPVDSSNGTGCTASLATG